MPQALSLNDRGSCSEFAIRVTPRRRLLTARLVILLLGAALLLIYASMVSLQVTGMDGVLLDSARNLAKGKSFVTNGITVTYLPLYRHLTPPIPYLFYPLVPLVASAFFYLFGPHPSLVIVFPVVAYLASALLVFELGRRLFAVGTGVCAAAMVLMQPAMLSSTIEAGFTDPVLLCLLVTAVLSLFLAVERSGSQTVIWLIIAGIMVGLTQYARTAAMMLYVPMSFLAFTAAMSRRVRTVAIFVASSLVTLLPLIAWNVVHAGVPTITPTSNFLLLTRSFPGFSAAVSVLSPKPGEVFHQYGQEIARKWLSQLWVHYKYFFTTMNPLVLAAAGLIWFVPLTDSQRKLRNFAVVLYINLAVLNSLVIWDNRYLLPVVPFFSLLGFEFLRRFVISMRGGIARYVAIGSLGLVVSIESIDFFYQTAKSRTSQALVDRLNLERTRFMKQNLRPTDVLVAADEGLVAWETENAAVGMPIDLPTAETIRQRFINFNALLLETNPPHSDLYNLSPDWTLVARGEKRFLDFQIENSTQLSSGETLVLLRSASSLADQQDKKTREAGQVR